MAAPKRPHAGGPITDATFDDKRTKLANNEISLQSFLSWCDREKLLMSQKVRVGKEGSCAQYGMIATDIIEPGECLFEIPRHMLLTEQTSSIAKLLQEESNEIKSKSGWVPLLLALLHEYTSPVSMWRPYLDLVPDYSQLNLPMFWSEQEREEELTGSGVDVAVKKDIDSLTREFTDVALPFIQKHPKYFTTECEKLDLYKKMVAFVMAYSFTEPAPDLSDDSDDDDEEKDEEMQIQTPPPMMVPMADILNHVAKNNAHLDFGEKSLKMVATTRIQPGEEVFNTYGEQSNMNLLHMYGFTEAYPNNHYDTVELPMTTLLEVFLTDQDHDAQELVRKKCLFLQDQLGVVSADGSFVLGVDGILTDDDMHTSLKVLCMEEEAFLELERQHCKQQDGWQVADDDDDDEPHLSNEDIPKLLVKWKHYLKRMAQACLECYSSSLEEEETTLSSDVWTTLSTRQQYCVHLRHGQMKLLHKLITLTNS